MNKDLFSKKQLKHPKLIGIQPKVIMQLPKNPNHGNFERKKKEQKGNEK